MTLGGPEGGLAGAQGLWGVGVGVALLLGAPLCARMCRLSHGQAVPLAMGLAGFGRVAGGWGGGCEHRWDPKSQIRLVLSVPSAHISH